MFRCDLKPCQLYFTAINRYCVHRIKGKASEINSGWMGSNVFKFFGASKVEERTPNSQDDHLL